MAPCMPLPGPSEMLAPTSQDYVHGVITQQTSQIFCHNDKHQISNLTSVFIVKSS